MTKDASHHEYVEINEAELDIEIARMNAAISPITMLARRLESNLISNKDAAEALRGIAILIDHKCQEIIEGFTSRGNR